MTLPGSPRSLGCAFVLALTLPIACNTSSSSQAPASSSAASASAPSAPTEQASAPIASASVKPPRRGDRGGPAGTLFAAARELTLSDGEKTAIDALEAQRETSDIPTDDLKDVQVDTVAGIRAGKLDTAKLQADFAAFDKTVAARGATEATAVSGLYAALEPAQRKELVTAVRARQAARDAQMNAHDGMDAGAAQWTKRRLARLTEQLGLDAAQQKSVDAILAKSEDVTSPSAMHAMGEEGKKRMEAILTAFEGNNFDAAVKKLDLTGAPGKTPHEGLEKDTSFLSQLLPILTPEQREKLAVQRERSGPRRRPEGHPGPGQWHGPPPGGGPNGGAANAPSPSAPTN
jgi:Spy/CpxP family protein refolding chaperone